MSAFVLARSGVKKKAADDAALLIPLFERFL
jgi:hypothetical protein